MDSEIYVIRHGLTESNKRKVYAGWKEEGLCSEGMRRISDMSQRLKEFQIKKIYSSPIRRAVQTAEIIDSTLKVGVVIENHLKEMRMHSWEGLSENEVAAVYPEEWRVWNTKPSELKMENRETLRDLLLRALVGIKRISGLSTGSNVLAVTHIAIIRMLIIYYNELPMDDYKKIEIPNGAVFLIKNNTCVNKIIRAL